MAPIYALPLAGMLFLFGGLLWMGAGAAANIDAYGVAFWVGVMALTAQCVAVSLVISA